MAVCNNSFLNFESGVPCIFEGRPLIRVRPREERRGPGPEGTQGHGDGEEANSSKHQRSQRAAPASRKLKLTLR